jgi:hypothetical protein
MRRPLVAAALAFGTAFAAPTCQELLTAFEHSLATAASVTIAVTLEQGGREVAFERSRVERSRDGERRSVTLERRGLRRPDGGGAPAGGGGALPGCERYDLALDGEHAQLTLLSTDPDAPAASVTMRFRDSTAGWLPEALEAPFTVRVLFVNVRGRFLTTFDAWSFPTTDPSQEETR